MWARAHSATVLVAALLVAIAATAAEQAATDSEPSPTDINKKLTNPVSELWSITFQQNNFRVDVGPSIGERWNSNVLANWKEDGGDTWTVPIGAAAAKVLKLGKLPVRISLAGQYMPIRPDVFGQKWNLQVLVAPVLPKLVRGNLTDPRSLEFGLEN